MQKFGILTMGVIFIFKLRDAQSYASLQLLVTFLFKSMKRLWMGSFLKKWG